MRFFSIKKTCNTNFGLLYKFPFLYPPVMNFLYGKSYLDRYIRIAKLIPSNTSIVDVCCGDAKLYEYLKTKKISYLGLDISRQFIKSVIKKDINAKICDIRTGEIPKADYIVMQGSLYQFDNHLALVKKLYKSSKKALIISEPIKNLKDSIIAKTFLNHLIPFIVGTENKDKHFRFNEKQFKELLSDYNPTYIPIKGKRDMIAIIKKGN